MSTTGGINSNPQAQIADAKTVHDSVKAFADLGYPWQTGGETVFYDALAREGVMSVQGTVIGLPAADQAHLASTAPYEWNYMQTPDTVMRNLAAAGFQDKRFPLVHQGGSHCLPGCP